MTSWAKITWAIVALVAILGAIGLMAYSSEQMAEARAFEKKFASVKLGDPESQALALLGNPDAKEATFRIGQEQGYEEAYARARASGSRYYLVWARGGDVVFSVGIDAQGRVRAKEYGGT